jgi:hypothetical protein
MYSGAGCYNAWWHSNVAGGQAYSYPPHGRLGACADNRLTCENRHRQQRRRRSSAPHEQTTKRWPPFNVHKLDPHRRISRRMRKDAAKYGRPWWQTEELRREHDAADEKAKRAKNHKDLEARIKELHRLQKPTHIRVWDHFGRSYLRRAHEERRKRSSGSSSRESLASVETV